MRGKVVKFMMDLLIEFFFLLPLNCNFDCSLCWSQRVHCSGNTNKPSTWNMFLYCVPHGFPSPEMI